MTGRKVMSDDLLIRLNDLADARHDDLDVAAEAAVRIIDQAWRIAELETTLRELAAERDALRGEVERLRGAVQDAFHEGFNSGYGAANASHAWEESWSASDAWSSSDARAALQETDHEAHK